MNACEIFLAMMLVMEMATHKMVNAGQNVGEVMR